MFSHFTKQNLITVKTLPKYEKILADLLNFDQEKIEKEIFETNADKNLPFPKFQYFTNGLIFYNQEQFLGLDSIIIEKETTEDIYISTLFEKNDIGPRDVNIYLSYLEETSAADSITGKHIPARFYFVVEKTKLADDLPGLREGEKSLILCSIPFGLFDEKILWAYNNDEQKQKCEEILKSSYSALANDEEPVLKRLPIDEEPYSAKFHGGWFGNKYIDILISVQGI